MRLFLQTYLGNQDLVTGLHAGGDSLSILIQSTGTNSQNLCLVGILNSRLGEEDAASGLSFGLYALNEDAVEERRNGADGLEDGLDHC